MGHSYKTYRCFDQAASWEGQWRGGPKATWVPCWRVGTNHPLAKDPVVGGGDCRAPWSRTAGGTAAAAAVVVEVVVAVLVMMMMIMMMMIIIMVVEGGRGVRWNQRRLDPRTAATSGTASDARVV